MTASIPEIRGKSPDEIKKLPLFCVAYERYSRRARFYVPGLEYLHAEDSGHARSQFCVSHPNRRQVRIVGVAPVIGYFVDSYNGQTEQLSV